MIESIILNYLDSKLEVPVYTEIPLNQPDSFVVIEKMGSSRENYIHYATFTLQSYAPSMYLAAELNEKVKIAMDNIIELDEISSSKLNTDYNYTDTEKKQYRYQAVYDLIY